MRRDLRLIYVDESSLVKIYGDGKEADHFSK